MNDVTGLFLDGEAFHRLLVERWIGLYNPYPEWAIDLFHGNPLLPPPNLVKNRLRDLGDRIRVVGGDNTSDLDLYTYRAPEIINEELEAAVIKDLRGDGFPVRAGNREIIVGAGITQLTSALIHAFTQRGQSVLFPTPTYTYALLAARQIAGKTRVLAPASGDSGYSLDVQRIQDALATEPDIGAIFLVNPGNPTGEVLSAGTLNALGKIVLRHRHVVVIMDEIYRQMILDGSAFTAFGALRCDGNPLFERTITLRGVSKCYGLAKIRIGVAAAPRELLEMLPLRTFIWFQTAAPSEIDQLIAATAISRTSPSYHRLMNKTYRNLAQFVVDRVSQINERVGRTVIKSNLPRAGSFMLLRLINLRQPQAPGWRTDAEITHALLQGGVALIPGSVFGIPEADRVVRLTYTSPIQDLTAGLDIIESLITDTQ